ncbi:uncharacterized protein SPSC_02134 [Sporisorium scitamineum]|uniref:Anaphase-promoting complex subunit 4 n=1 Tax=Sporisorium scitamineum TaxID=49012 RepID=A0A0F7RV77_9BASI|nr:hypothetical protein [Sporisorium scitamineum]CDU23505.1 uncharacterized protein SPSC_02134 [Sporisorium scitamineum]
MPVSLTDGSIVGDGSQIGIFPVLADQRLDKPATLLRTSANPRMDLVLLILKDAASQSAPAPTAPPGMSAAQFALVQRMLAARQRGAQASAAQGAPDPKRGPQIHLVLWRMGDESSAVWSVPLNFDKVMDLAPNALGASQQEHEDIHLHDLAWSPKGDRVAVLASVKRSPVASTSTTSWRVTTFLRTYSVQDGRLLSTVPVHSWNHTSNSSNTNADNFAQPMTATWLDVDFGVANDAVDGSSESILTKFSPLPPLPTAETFASAGGTGNLMPHQLRMMQMSGRKPPPNFQFPSHLAVQGRGSLASIPHLAKADTDLRLLEGGDTALALDPDRALPLSPETVVLVSRAATARANLILDGQINIGSLQLQHTPEAELDDPLGCPSRPLWLSPDMTRIVSVSLSSDLAISQQQLELPLPVTTRYGPLSTRRKIAAVSRASHLLRFYLGYALDSASALQQVYQKELVQKVTNEWSKNIDDLSMKFGGDMKYELINVLLTGRAGPAAEQFLLGNLTEGVLTRLEQQAHTAMYALKKLISESLKPALERCIVCLSSLVGQCRFFGKSEQGLGQALKILQASLDSTLSLAKEVDMEALVSQEFYRWCRTERERQERIKQDQDEPRLPITYDVHYVAAYIDRGFENEEIHARMSDKVAAEAIEQVLADVPKRASLRETLEAAQAFLAAPGRGSAKAKAQREKSEPSEKSIKVPLAILPTLSEAVEMLGSQLTHLLDADLERSTVEQTVPAPAAKQGLGLAREPAPALSMSSSTEIEPRANRICATSVISAETLYSAYVLRSASQDASSSNSVLVTRQNTLVANDAAVAHFTIPCTEDVSILDLGFYGESELLILAQMPSTSISVLLGFDLADLPFTSDYAEGSGNTVVVTPSRATEFEKDFKPVKLAVNTNKQTVTVIEEDGKRIMYLDISAVDIGDVAMQEED